MGGGDSRTPSLSKSSHAHKKLKPCTLCLLSILCIHFGIASYQPFIDTAFILLCGGIIAIIIDNNGDLKSSLYKSRFLIISVALATASYKIVFDILKKLNIVQNAYNNQMIALSEMPERILLAIKMGFESLFAYNVPFMPEFIAILFGVFVVILLILLFGAKLTLSAKLSIVIVLCGAIVASQTHIALAKIISTGIITDYYGVLFLRVIIVALVFKLVAQTIHAQTLRQNLIFVLSCVIIWAYAIQSLNAQKVLKLTMERDFHYINRIVARIETSENFSYDKKYCGVMFGVPQNRFREGFNADILPYWEMQNVFRYSMSKNIFDDCIVYSDLIQKAEFNNPKEAKVFNALISRLHKAGILDKLEPFPHKNSVVVFEDIIIFVASEGDLEVIRKKAKELQ